MRMTSAVEVHETYIGGKKRNKQNSKKLKAGWGAVDKTAVVGVSERNNRKSSSNLQGFIMDIVEKGSAVFADEAKAYV